MWGECGRVGRFTEGDLWSPLSMLFEVKFLSGSSERSIDGTSMPFPLSLNPSLTLRSYMTDKVIQSLVTFLGPSDFRLMLIGVLRTCVSCLDPNIAC